jgi:hypothetical protein
MQKNRSKVLGVCEFSILSLKNNAQLRRPSAIAIGGFSERLAAFKNKQELVPPARQKLTIHDNGGHLFISHTPLNKFCTSAHWLQSLPSF